MSAPTRLVWAAVAFVGLAAAVPLVGPSEGFRLPGRGLWDAPAAVEELVAAAEEAEVAGDAHARLRRQIVEGERVADDAATGRLTLAAAVERLAEVNREREGFLFALRRIHPAARTDREALALQVIAMAARRNYPEPPDQATVARLDAEYRAMDCRACGPSPNAAGEPASRGTPTGITGPRRSSSP